MCVCVCVCITCMCNSGGKRLGLRTGWEYNFIKCRFQNYACSQSLLYKRIIWEIFKYTFSGPTLDLLNRALWVIQKKPQGRVSTFLKGISDDCCRERPTPTCRPAFQNCCIRFCLLERWLNFVNSRHEVWVIFQRSQDLPKQKNTCFQLPHWKPSLECELCETQEFISSAPFCIASTQNRSCHTEGPR